MKLQKRAGSLTRDWVSLALLQHGLAPSLGHALCPFLCPLVPNHLVGYCSFGATYKSLGRLMATWPMALPRSTRP